MDHEILRINGIAIAGRKAREMKAYRDALPAGKPARFTILRGRQTVSLEMIMGD